MNSIWPYLKRGWDWFVKHLAAISFALGIIGIVLALYFNHQQNLRTDAKLQASVASTCTQQRARNDQWDRTIDALKDITRRPDGSVPDFVVRFGTQTKLIYSDTPACRLAK